MPIDPEEARRYQEGRKQQKEQSQGDRAGFYSLPREGQAKVRHLPHWEDPSKIPGRIIWQHWQIPEMNKCICFRTWKMDCRTCSAISKFTGLIKTEEWEAKGRSYTNALILEDTSNPSGVNSFIPKILGINGYVEFDLDWIVGLSLNPDFGDVTDPFNGRDIVYRRKKKDGAWDKQVIPRVRPIGDSPEKVREILSKMANLDMIFPKEPRDEDFQSVVKASGLLLQSLETKLSALMKKGPSYQQPSNTAVSSPVQQSIAPPPVQSTTQPVFKPEWTNTKCSICGESQYTTPSGNTCKNGHGGAPPPIQKSTVPSSTQSATKKGYPECYGTAVFGEGNKKCIVCSKSFDCEEVVKKQQEEDIPF